MTEKSRRKLCLLVIVLSASLPQWSSSAGAEAGYQSIGTVRLEAHVSAQPMLAFLESRIVPAPPRVREEVTQVQPPPAPPAVRNTLSGYSEYVILRALRQGDSAFSRCWERSAQSDLVRQTHKAQLVLEVDATGVVRSARTDSDQGELPACVATVGRRLPFPAIGRPATLKLLLLF